MKKSIRTTIRKRTDRKRRWDLSTHYTAELLPKEKVFRDPVHDYIHIQYRIIMDLINAP